MNKMFKFTLAVNIVFLLFVSLCYGDEVRLGPEYYPSPAKGKPLSSASIYVGLVDTDPEVVANQKTITALQENGSTVTITQPVTTSAGGIPLYNGSPVSLSVFGDYSLKVLDSFGAQVYYIPDSNLTGSGEVRSFASVAEMVASSLLAGNSYFTQGYYNSGDGGAAEYLIVDIATYGSTPDDTGDHLVNSGTHVAVLQYGVRINWAQFGAVPNDLLADSDSINASVDAFRLLVARTEGDLVDTTQNASWRAGFFPSQGVYIIDKTINMTAIDLAASQWSINSYGCVFYLRTTAKVGFDLIDARSLVWSGGMIIGEENYVSKYGIQIGRNSTLKSAGGHRFVDLHVKGYFSHAALYNYTSELFTMDGGALWNDYDAGTAYCLIQDGDNYFGIVEDNQTGAPADTGVSFLLNRFNNVDIRMGGTGSSVWMSNTSSHEYNSVYTVSVSDANYVLFSNTSNIGNNNLTIKGHNEVDGADLDPLTGVDYTVYFDAANTASGVQLTNFKFNETKPHAQVSIFGHGANVDSVVFKNADVYISRLGRNVGQTLTDVPADYFYSGRYVTLDETGQLDLDNFQSFDGDYYNTNSASYGHVDGGDFVLSDPSGSWFKNGIKGMVDSSNIWMLRIYDLTKTLLATWNISEDGVFPSVNNADSLGLTDYRMSSVYSILLYFGPAGSDIFLSAGGGSPEGVVSAGIGSIYMATGTGTMYRKQSGTGTTGWVTP